MQPFWCFFSKYVKHQKKVVHGQAAVCERGPLAPDASRRAHPARQNDPNDFHPAPKNNNKQTNAQGLLSFSRLFGDKWFVEGKLAKRCSAAMRGTLTNVKTF